MLFGPRFRLTRKIAQALSMFGLVPNPTPMKQKLPKILSKTCMTLKDLAFKSSMRERSPTTFSGLDWVAEKSMTQRRTLWTMQDSFVAQMKKATLPSVKNVAIFVRYIDKL